MEKKKRFLVKCKLPGKTATTERQVWALDPEEAYDYFEKQDCVVVSVWEQRIYTETQRVRVVE